MRIGIVGGGQLGRMLAFDAKKMGFTVRVVDPTPDSPASQVVDEQILGGYSDAEATKKLAAVSDFITVEIEHINTDTLSELVKNGVKVNPSPKTIEIIKDKFQQKLYLQKNKIPTSDFVEVKTQEDIEKIGKKFGYPMVLKAKKDAFDGRGNALIKSKNAINSAMEKLSGRELYVEKYVPFSKELAVVLARSMAGKVALYPVVETIHKNNICHIVISPAQIDEEEKKKAERLAKKVLSHLKGAGVFAVEMFVTKNGDVLVNEIAPRVHNSGHLTIEANVTSQFEQHIRAITGLPLGNTQLLVPAAVMINILGERKGLVEITGLEKVLAMPGVFVHIYGKSETKIDRKMGHITVLDETTEKALQKAKKARRLLSI
ncbi:5-(carboxyamino)imidazole ribonucleotide synthase [soil metagenome]